MRKLVLMILLSTVAAGAFAQSGIIREFSGTVEIKTAGDANFVPAAAGAELKQDTVISTGFKSTAIVEVGSTVIAVRPLTRLTLAEIRASQGTETLNVNLQAGRVRVDVNPPAGTKVSMSVTSPSATASVRGTGFEFDTRNINVQNGTVFFNGNNGYTVQVGAGFFAGVTGYNQSSGPQSSSNTGLTPPLPVGYDPTAKSTGGGGVSSASESEAPPESPPSSGPSSPSGGGGGTGGNPEGDVDVGLTFLP